VDNTLLGAWLARWTVLAAPPGVVFRTPDALAGVLNDVRHAPETLALLLSPLPQSADLLDRLAQVLAWERPGWDGAYVEPERVPATDEELVELAQDALDRARHFAEVEAEGPVRVRRVELGPGDWAWAAPLTEAANDRFIHAESGLPSDRRTAVQLLREPAYRLTADFGVLNWILTPLHAAELRQLDPYRPQVELWRRGARATVTWGERFGEGITVFVEPEDAPDRA
jgi:hypothetical protein